MAYDHTRSTWGLGDFFASLAIYLVSSGIVGVALLATAGDNVFEGPRVLAIAVPPVLQLVHVRWVAGRKGRGLASDFGFRFQRSDLALGLRLVVMGMVGAAVYAAVLLAFGVEPPTAAALEMGEQSSDGRLRWSVLAFAAAATFVIPPAEELVFRGLLWNALEKRGVSPRTTLVVTSAIFAAIHLELTRTPILFAIGLAFGWGRYTTGRLGSSVIAHVGINAIGMVALLTSL